ncbi:MAG: YkgJ family cysteine cluster protein [Desulfobacterales bacterium]
MPFKSVSPKDLFVCQKCGDCCRGYGGTYVSREDILAISDYIRVSADEFMARYCQMSGGRPVIAVQENGFCVFWDEVCTIHPVKPEMCKAWPFIESVVIDIENWHIMAGVCPGIRTNYPDHVIRECVRKVITSRDLDREASHTP